MSMPGTISTERTVWCGECSEWLQLSARTLLGFKTAIRAKGWKIRARRWCCPACQLEHTKDLVTAHEGRPIIVPDKAAVRAMVLEKSREIKGRLSAVNDGELPRPRTDMHELLG